MDIEIKRGNDITDEEFPLFSETLEYFELIMDVDDFGVSYFRDQLKLDADYAVIRTEDFRELTSSARRRLLKEIAARGLDGTQSSAELEEFIENLILNTVDEVVTELTELHHRGLSAEEKAEIDALVAEVDADYHHAAAHSLEALLTNENVGRLLESDSPFLSTSPADDDMMARIRDLSMPAYFVIDVSLSMEEQNRIDYANEFAQQVSRHLRESRITDELKCLIFWGENRFVDLQAPERFPVDFATATGDALAVICDDIRARNYGRPVFLALVTDGVPNRDGEYQGELLNAVDYTVKMASLLPDNVLFTQIAFAPLDSDYPENPSTFEEFQRYLNDLKRVTDAVKHGQTYVMVKDCEEHFPWLPLGAFQKAKQFSLLDAGFAALEDF